MRTTGIAIGMFAALAAFAGLDGCEQKGTEPRSKAIKDSDDGDGCRISHKSQSSWLVIALGFLALSWGRKHRRGQR